MTTTRLKRVKNEQLQQYEYYCPQCGQLLQVIPFDIDTELFVVSHKCIDIVKPGEIN